MNPQMNPIVLPLFALISVALGVGLGVIGYVIPGDATSRQQIFQLAMALITGGGGFMAGHAATKLIAQQQPQKPTPPQNGAQPQ